MSFIKMRNSVPEIYNTSRDFQVMERVFDIALNAMKFDIDSIVKMSDTDFADARTLGLLQTKLGFFTKSQLTNDDDDLRLVLEAFPEMVKIKGSMDAIDIAVRTFLKVNNTSANYSIDYGSDKSTVDDEDSMYHVITINMDSEYINTTLLTELLQYVLPTGYLVRFGFVKSVEVGPTTVGIKDSVTVTSAVDNVTSTLRNSGFGDSSNNDYMIASIGNTEIVTNKTIGNTQYVEDGYNSDTAFKYLFKVEFDSIDDFTGTDTTTLYVDKSTGDAYRYVGGSSPYEKVIEHSKVEE